jgi:hypothetical protein
VIVATADATTVQVTSSTTTFSGGTIPVIAAGSTYTLPVLNTGDFAQIDGHGPGFGGTRILANNPVAVFSAHPCANVPDDMGWCDHLEEQLPGVQSFGVNLVAARMPVRSVAYVEQTYWQIVASQDATHISFSAHPAVTGLPPSTVTLQAGDTLDLAVGGTAAHPGDFVVSADKPILMIELLSGGETTDVPMEIAGDPALNLVVPTEQYLDVYAVIVPPNWINDFLIVARPIGGTVEIDSFPVAASAFTEIDDGVDPPQWEVARVSIADGPHVLTGSDPFGAVIVGYDAYDSYAYAAGMALSIINP